MVHYYPTPDDPAASEPCCYCLSDKSDQENMVIFTLSIVPPPTPLPQVIQACAPLSQTHDRPHGELPQPQTPLLPETCPAISSWEAISPEICWLFEFNMKQLDICKASCIQA